MMNASKTTLLIACIVIISSTINISPWELYGTVTTCTKGFKVDVNYQYAVCVTGGGVLVFKWSTDKFVIHSILLPSLNVNQVSITGDGQFISFIAILSDEPKLYIFQRTSGTTTFVNRLTQKVTFGFSQKFHLTENHLYLSYSPNSTHMIYAEWDDNRYKQVQSFMCNKCSSIISEDGTILIINAFYGDHKVYKKDSDGKFQFHKAFSVSLSPTGIGANPHDSSNIYIAGEDLYDLNVMIVKYDGEDIIKEYVPNIKDQEGNSFTIISSAVSPDNKWFSFLHKNDPLGTSIIQDYCLIQKSEGTYTAIHNDTHTQLAPNIEAVSFQQLTNGLLIHTVTFSTTGTSIYAFLDCTAVAHSTGENDDFENCVCQADATWISASKTCLVTAQVDCSADSSSTGVQLDNGQCQCLPYHFWDSSNSQCKPHCNRNLALNKDPGDEKACLCRENTVWSQQFKDCVLTCAEVTHSTGQQQWYEVCECKQGSNWNPTTLKCDLNCSHIIQSTGEFKIGDNSCECEQDHSWVAEALICKRDCGNDEQTGEVLKDGTCQCVEGAIWNNFVKECVNIDCGKIMYAIELTQDKLGCTCKDDFEWIAQKQLCEIQCASLTNPLGKGGLNLNTYACQCLDGSYWEQSAKSCIRNCTIISNSTGQNTNNVQCTCQLGFIWNSAGTCDSNCIGIGEKGTYDDTNFHCECSDDFVWSNDYSACYRDCSGETRGAFLYEGPTQQSCGCHQGYTWDGETKHCELDCNGQFDTGILGDKTKCTCESNAQFLPNQAKCMVKCTLDQLSLKTFHVDQCDCKSNAHWNSDPLANKCECNQGFSLNSATKSCISGTSAAGSVSLGAIGGAIASGSLMFLGIHFYQKKKRNEKKGEDSIIIDQGRKQMPSSENIDKLES